MTDAPSSSYGIEVVGEQDGKRISKTLRMSELYGGDWGRRYFKVRASDFTDDVMNEAADITLEEMRGFLNIPEDQTEITSSLFEMLKLLKSLRNQSLVIRFMLILLMIIKLFNLKFLIIAIPKMNFITACIKKKKRENGIQNNESNLVKISPLISE